MDTGARCSLPACGRCVICADPTAFCPRPAEATQNEQQILSAFVLSVVKSMQSINIFRNSLKQPGTTSGFSCGNIYAFHECAIFRCEHKIQFSSYENGKISCADSVCLKNNMQNAIENTVIRFDDYENMCFPTDFNLQFYVL